MTPKFALDGPLAQDLLDYLGERPFREVANLVMRMTQLPMLEEPVASDAETNGAVSVAEGE